MPAANPTLRAHVRTSTLRAVLGFPLASRRSRHLEDTAYRSRRNHPSTADQPTPTMLKTATAAMRVALVYPPTCDPTAPYLAVPMLTGFLRAHGVDVLPIDANIEAWDGLLAPAPMAAARDRLETRLSELDRRASLVHQEQLEYAALARARGDSPPVPAGGPGGKERFGD